MGNLFSKRVNPGNVQLGNAMEESFQRFSHLPERIFEHLDNVSIVKCREVNKSWQEYLDQGKVLRIRIIQSIRSKVGNFHEVGESWEAAFKTLNTEAIRELGIAVKDIYICLLYTSDAADE